MVYRTIIDVILHLFIICNDLWCQLPFFSQTFRHNGSAVFGTMPPMCRSCPDVNKLRGMETTILGQHRPFMSIKSFVQHSGWQEMVSLCSLIRLIGVCADRDQPEFLCSRSDSRHLEVHVATAGGWLTRYRPREVRNSIYRYRKIHIDYRSKFLYRFISPISIIYGNTNIYVVKGCVSLDPSKISKSGWWGLQLDTWQLCNSLWYGLINSKLHINKKIFFSYHTTSDGVTVQCFKSPSWPLRDGLDLWPQLIYTLYWESQHEEI